MATLFAAVDPNAAFRGVQSTRVSVNGVRIPASDIAREVQHHAAGEPLAAWRAAARALALRELMLQEARRCGLQAEPLTDGDGRRETEDEALVRALVAREVATPEPDAASCRRYYEQNRRRFRSADLYEAAHILLAIRPDDADPLAGPRDVASGILLCLASAPERFAELAAAVSACPSRQAGGNLGQIGAGDTVAEFEAALFRLGPGEITPEPVVSRYGLHIIRLDRKIAGRALPFELVHVRIAGYLAERSTRLAAAQYLARLAAAAEIEGVELPSPADRGVM